MTWKFLLSKYVVLMVVFNWRNIRWGFDFPMRFDTIFGSETVAGAYLPMFSAFVSKLEMPKGRGEDFVV